MEIDLASSVNTSGWENKIYPFEAGAFWSSNIVKRKGYASNLFIKEFSKGIITPNEKLLSFRGRDFYIDDNFIKNYNEFVSYPIEFEGDALFLLGNSLYSITITGDTADIKIYQINTDATTILTTETNRTVYNLSNRVSTTVYYDGTDIKIVQIGITSFAIDNILYNFPINDNSKFFNVNGNLVIAEPNVRVRTFNLTDQTFATITNAVNAYNVNNDIVAVMMGDIWTARLVINTAVIESWIHPAAATDITIYSQTFSRDLPFTIFTGLVNDVRKFWWATTTAFQYLETTNLDDETIIPTVDFNRVGLTSSLTTQFNRLVILKNLLAMTEQAGNYLGISYNGVLIAPIGMGENAQFDKVNGDTFVVIENMLIIIGVNVPPKINLIGGSNYKINAADIWNILSNEKLFTGSVDWNNRVKPEQVLRLVDQIVDLQPQELAVFNSALGANYEVDGNVATSVLTASSRLAMRTVGSLKMFAPINTTWQEVNQELLSLIDYYYTKSADTTFAEYQTTGFRFTKSELIGLAFPEPTTGSILIPAPVNSRYASSLIGVSLASWGDWHNIGLRANFNFLDTYPLTSELDLDGVLFSISGSNYFYNGKIIFSLTFVDAVLQSREQVNNTDGMIFVGCNSTEAYFLSSDNYLWVFTGSYALSLTLDLTRFGEFKNIYNYNNNVDELALVFSENVIAIRKGVIRFIPFNVLAIQNTNRGLVYETEENQLLLLLSETDKWLNFYIDTGWIGTSEDMITNFTRVWLRLAEKAEFIIKVDSLNDYLEEGIEKTINSNEIIIIPKQPLARAIRVRIYSRNVIKINSFTIDGTSQAVIPALHNRSK